MPKVYYDPSLGKGSVVDVGLRESGHLRDDISIKVSLNAAAGAGAVGVAKEKMTGVRSQTVVSSSVDFQSTRPVKTFEFGRNAVVSSSGDSNKVSQEGSATEDKTTGKKIQTAVSSPSDFQGAQNAQRKTFEFKRDALIKSDGGLKNVAQEDQRLANPKNLQNSSTTQKGDGSGAKPLSEEMAFLSTNATATTPKSTTPNTTNEPPLGAADLTTSTKTAGSDESKSTNDPNEVGEKSTIDSSGRKVLGPVSRRSANTSIDPAHTAQGYFAPKKVPSSTHITAASPSSTTSKAHSTSAFKPPVTEKQVASTPNPTTQTNPFYATNTTLPSPPETSSPTSAKHRNGSLSGATHPPHPSSPTCSAPNGTRK